MPALPFVPFDAFWIVVAALLVVTARILVLLRTGHREVWVELGRPRLLPRSGAGSAALTRFYWSDRVDALGDPDLSRWVRSLRVLQVLFAVVLATLWAPLIAAL